MNALRLVGASIFLAGGVAAFGVAVALFYETFAYATGLVPTISNITVGEVIAHKGYAVVAAFIVGVLIGALAAHFGDWIP